MTDQNNAAQPGLTDDQIEALAKKHIAPHADRLEAIMTNPVPYQQTEQFRRVKALIVDVLSKLRAEGVQAGDETQALIEHDRWFSEYGQRLGPFYNSLTLHTRNAWVAAAKKYAALASAPVADERAAQGYGSPADVAQRIEQYLYHDGRKNSATQLLYEAMKALRRPAPAAGDALDAARYRWLCDQFGITKLPCAIERIIEGTYVADGKNGIDAAIDAAIAQQSQLKGDA